MILEPLDADAGEDGSCSSLESGLTTAVDVNRQKPLKDDG